MMSHSSTVTSRRLVRLRRLMFSAGIGITLAAGVGCQSLSKMPTLSSPTTWFQGKSVEEQHGVPQRLVALWTEDVLNQSGKPSTRGFGARIYFYDAQDKAIQVDGQLVIYAYDDSKPQTGPQRAPDRKFVFTPEDFKTHFSESQLGASYSIWIPWDGIDGPRTDISLVPVFTSVSGKIVVGAQTINVLNAHTATGKLATNQIRYEQKTTYPSVAPQGPATVQPTAHLESTSQQTSDAATPANGQPTSPTRMRSTTIPITGAMSERLRTAPPTPLVGLPLAPSTAAATASPPPTTGSAPAETLSPPPAVHSEPPKSPAPTSPSVPRAAVDPRNPPYPVGSPFLRPSRS